MTGGRTWSRKKEPAEWGWTEAKKLLGKRVWVGMGRGGAKLGWRRHTASTGPAKGERIIIKKDRVGTSMQHRSAAQPRTCAMHHRQARCLHERTHARCSERGSGRSVSGGGYVPCRLTKLSLLQGEMVSQVLPSFPRRLVGLEQSSGLLTTVPGLDLLDTCLS
jgi:hypothetical protein